jgi:FkbM family methyltransferase
MLLDHPTSHDKVLQRVAKWGIKFDHFFDIGAAEGMWGKMIRLHWPLSAIHYFEAAPAWQKNLLLEADNIGGKTTINMCAVGDADGDAFFRYDPQNPYGGALLSQMDVNTIKVPKLKLDTFIAQHNLQGRYCLKLDTHGAERLILSGAKIFMQSCDLVIFESYNFGPAQRRFGQMAVYLEEEFGLRCFDIAEPKCRPYDNALWQIDFYFARPEGTTLSEWRL